MSDSHFDMYLHHTGSPLKISETLLQPQVFLGHSRDTAVPHCCHATVNINTFWIKPCKGLFFFFFNQSLKILKALSF